MSLLQWYKDVQGDIFSKTKKQEPYFDIDYEQLQIFKFVQSDEEDNAEFSIINLNLFDPYLKDSDSVSNTHVVSTIFDN